jgi:hypothetical protein
MGVVMIFKYGKRFRFAPSFNHDLVLRFKSEAKIYRNSRKLNQSINGGSHDFQIWKTIPLRSIV